MYCNPFPNITLGLQHGSYNTPARDYRPIGDTREFETVDRNPYKDKYNAKEWQDELGLNVYDFEARNYMPDLARSTTFDPHMENYMSLSPYSFFGNNPLIFKDPNGKDILFWQYDQENKKWNQVTFNQLDKTTQKAIIDFASTESGYKYLQLFADSDGQQFGDINIQGVLTNMVADLYINEGGFNDKSTSVMKASTAINGAKVKKMIGFNLKYTKLNSRVQNAISLGHEAFIHEFSNDGKDMKDLIIYALMFKMHPNRRNLEAFEKAEVDYYKAVTAHLNNPKLNHSNNGDHQYIRQGLDYSFQTYIQQLKYVLNPSEVNATHINSVNQYKSHLE